MIENKLTNCKQCNKLLTIQKTYCSYKCKYDYQNFRWKRKCENCQKDFIVPLNRRSHILKKPTARNYCCLKCFQENWSNHWKEIKKNKIINNN